MDWDDLRVFLAVARAESLTGAGKRLRLDPATVGRRVQRLETALGARLFTKSPQGYGLTETGQRLLGEAETVERGVQGALAEAQEPERVLSGTIRLGAPDGCATYILPQVVAQIVAENPELDVQLVALPRVFNLSKREADMAIAVSPPTAGRLTVQKLAAYRLWLGASETYIAQHGGPSRLSDLPKHRIVGYIPDMIHDRALDYQGELGTERVVLASNSVPVQLAWIRTGAGLGIVHGFALPFAPEVRRILPEAFELTRQFFLIRHADDRRVERLRLFADKLAVGVRREVARLEALVSDGPVSLDRTGDEGDADGIDRYH
ncbi:LysR family transcriptional regulator [Algicella marina]|uniref:LysR family transcriptional regulator n=1 Tax=Algicella marina TaxID=2683284 RepID=A0A6P1SZR9_9RHOB|nr:LysR family transcriptional regulator [Algicella marina]QHQ34529.1 LysR family transcriptional regulator [Algicella marina]